MGDDKVCVIMEAKSINLSTKFHHSLRLKPIRRHAIKSWENMAWMTADCKYNCQIAVNCAKITWMGPYICGYRQPVRLPQCKCSPRTNMGRCSAVTRFPGVERVLDRRAHPGGICPGSEYPGGRCPCGGRTSVSKCSSCGYSSIYIGLQRQEAKLGRYLTSRMYWLYIG